MKRYNRLYTKKTRKYRNSKDLEPTFKQKRWIKDRDGHTCQLAISDCSDELQVHHIIARTWAYKVLKWEKIKINSPRNLITLCENCHSFIHGGWIYVESKEIPYWNTSWDKKLKNIAAKNSYKKIRQGEEYPYTKR